MKVNPDRAIHMWPRKGYRKPGPPRRFTRRMSEFCISIDHEAMIDDIKIHTGITTNAEVFRRSLELFYHTCMLMQNEVP